MYTVYWAEFYVNHDQLLLISICICLDIQCDNLSIPANGNISSCSSGRIGIGYKGDTCSFTCNTGFELIGSDVRMCHSDGVWNGTDTMCHKIGNYMISECMSMFIIHCTACLVCLSLSNPANGTMQCSLEDDGAPSYEESCVFTCNNGYQLIGSHTRTCQGNGRWNGTDSTCKRGIQAF